MNSTSIAPMKIKNKIYENQVNFEVMLTINTISEVWIKIVSPSAKGCVIWVKKIDKVVESVDRNKSDEIQKVV